MQRPLADKVRESSTCSACSFAGDRSNYWFPNLYQWNPQKQLYQMVHSDRITMYYFQEKQDMGRIKAFPKGRYPSFLTPAEMPFRLQNGVWVVYGAKPAATRGKSW